VSGKVIRRASIVLGALVVLAIVAFGPLVVSQLSKSTPGPALATASTHSFPVTATASGTLLPQSLVTVNFPIGGKLSEVAVSVGAQVTTGQLLAKLNDASQLAQLQAARARLASAYAVLAAAQASGNPGAIASAQGQVATAQGDVQQASIADSMTALYAPQPGTVLEVNDQVGDTVNAGTTGTPGVAGSSGTIIDPSALTTNRAFMVIGNGSSFQVSAAFSQSDAPLLKTGQTGTVSFDALPGVNFPCHVTSVANSASVVQGVSVFYAAVAPDQSDPRLRSGMTASVILDIAQATDVLAVPSQALYLLNNVSYVDVWYQGRAVPTQVTPGLVGDQYTQIASGLSSGQQVVLSTQQPLPSSAGAPSATPP
jgi:membrane fusion protein, macrolide-specific efflux system